MSYKGYKIRLYPTKEQENLFWKHIGARRYIYNWMLEMQIENYKNGGKFISAFSMCKLLTMLKKDGEHDWLYEISNATLQRTCADLVFAYKMMFEKTNGFPKFKSRKKSKPSFPLSETIGMVYFVDGKAQISKAGRVKYKTDYVLPEGRGQKFINPRIVYKNGKWFLSFVLECENQAPRLTDKPMGIDLGTRKLAVVSFGNNAKIFHNINKSSKVKKLEAKKAFYQKAVSRKYEASKKRTGRYEKTNNIIRLEDKIRKIHARLCGIRHNYIHQTTHELVSLLPYRVTMEDLDVQQMMKNKHQAKDIQEACWHEFVRQMKYKCEWNGIEFCQVDRYYPSSKTCSCCGYIDRDLGSKETYRCPKCGLVIDRDINAAINLMTYYDRYAA